MSSSSVRDYTERIITQVIPVELIDNHPDNYNFHPETQLSDLEQSYARRGQFLSKLVWARPSGRYTLVIGEGFTTGAKRGGAEALRCEVLPEDTPPEYVREILLADNLHARNSVPDEDVLARLLKEQQMAGVSLASLGSSEETLQQLLERLEDERLGLDGEFGVPKGKQPNPRTSPFDMIYTFNSPDASCCLAAKAGWRYGVQSSRDRVQRICPYTDRFKDIHKVTFVDNDYFHYEHAVHLAVVQAFRPKYATVKDVMTKTQCTKDAIEWTPLEHILEWAEELSQYAENVIVIPKYDCLDQIPDRFMLGYSIPTSHGGTPLPVDLFRGRRVHLLGGSWKAQLSYMAELGEDVVSADNNQIHLLATKFGQFVLPDGQTRSLHEAGFGALNNPLYVALALSLGCIGAKVYELYPHEQQDEQEEEEEEELCLTSRS